MRLVAESAQHMSHHAGVVAHVAHGKRRSGVSDKCGRERRPMTPVRERETRGFVFAKKLTLTHHIIWSWVALHLHRQVARRAPASGLPCAAHTGGPEKAIFLINSRHHLRSNRLHVLSKILCRGQQFLAQQLLAHQRIQTQSLHTLDFMQVRVRGLGSQTRRATPRRGAARRAAGRRW